MRSDSTKRRRSPLLAPLPRIRQQNTLAGRLGAGLICLAGPAILSAIAAFVQYVIEPVTGGRSAFMMFYPAVILSAWVGGLAGGLFAVAFSAAISAVLFLPHPGAVLIHDAADFGSLVAFSIVSAAIAWGTAALHASREQLIDNAEELAENEARFQALFDILPVGISIAQDPDCRVIRHNPTFAQWLGHPQEINASLSGPQASELPYKVMQNGKDVLPEDLPMPVAARTGRPCRDWEGEVVMADGRVIHLLGYASPLFGADGKVEGCLGTYVDITEMKSAEQERAAHLSEIEQLNRQLQRAVSETHHRVKNNLQVITALLNMELLHHEQTVPTESIDRIIHHVQSLAAIHDLLTHQSKASAVDQQISSRQALERLVPLVAGLVAGRQIHCQADDVPLNPRQASALAVLVNELISNAIKHGQGDIDLRLVVDGSCARLEVADSGPGFPAGFEPTGAANTGLELVEMVAHWDLQGETRYENRPEGGARVLADFPV